MINQDQVFGILRILVPMICALLAPQISALGDASMVAQITAAVLAIAAAVWTFMAHRESSKIASVARGNPDIHIQVPASLAASNDNVKAMVDDQGTYKNVTAKAA